MRMSQDDQIRFLLVCIQHANGGRVNFDGVVQDSNVVSKGAAAKRYERMVAQYGIKDNNPAWDAVRSPRERSDSSRKPVRSTRRRKLDDSCFNSFAGDDDDDEFDVPHDRKKLEQKPRVKTEPMPNMQMNYPPYMFQPLVPPYPQYVQRPVQPYMASNAGLNTPFPSNNFQFTQMQQQPSNYPYQMSPQLSPFTMPGSLQSAQHPNCTRAQDNTDNFFQNNASNFGTFEAMLNDPTSHLTGNLLGDEFSQPFQGLKRESRVEAKHIDPLVKTEPVSDAMPRSSGPSRLSCTKSAHDGVCAEDIISMHIIESSGTSQPELSANISAPVKQEELGSTILICD